jgi:hypothetical protein
MNPPNQKPDAQRLEELKKKHGIDEIIADRHHLPKRYVEKDLDPRIVKLILDFLGVRP